MRLKKFITKFSPNFKKIFVICLFTSLFFLIILYINHFFTIKYIEIVSKIKTNVRGIKYFTNKNLLLLSDKDVIEKLLLENPYIKNISINKVYPDKLLIYPTYTKQLVILKVSSGYFILGDNATILKKQQRIESNLPQINYYQKFDYYNFNIGDKLEYIEILYTLNFLIILNELGLKTDSIDINGLNMILFNLDNKKITFTTEKEETIQKYELEEIIKRFKIEGRDFKSLDLRFNKPIVKL